MRSLMCARISRSGLVGKDSDNDVKVYGKMFGHIEYRCSAENIENTYVNCSDDGRQFFTGRETIQVNPRVNFTYTADLRLTRSSSSILDLKMTFGPLGGERPAGLVFTPDTGTPLTHGYTEFNGKRLTVDGLAP